MGIEDFRKILGKYLLSDPLGSVTSGQPISKQFYGPISSQNEFLQKLNAGFLICLGEMDAPEYDSAREILSRPGPEESEPIRNLYAMGCDLIIKEIERVMQGDPEFGQILRDTSRTLDRKATGRNPHEAVRVLWRIFFPEGAELLGPRHRLIGSLREKRKIKVVRLNPDPINEPLNQILFTANVLLTIPMINNPSKLYCVPQELVETVISARHDPQRYWYDHPIPIGIGREKNEVIYGLKGLNDAVAFEKEFRGAPKSGKLQCVLSVCVTHDRLQDVAKPIVTEMIRSAGRLEHLNIFLWTENEARRLVRDVLGPCMRYYLGTDAEDQLNWVIGVNGEYGRHYSFLRAISAFWKVFKQVSLKGTFKIDLDQVFPQSQLVKETGLSAFEHFKTPLWGADGIDCEGQRTHMGMIAGALVNFEDSKVCLFVPDVSFPEARPEADEVVFFSRLPQALSTEAEMMTRYDAEGFNSGICIQRIHVTGGTCGILISSLRKYRPFTPTFVARAEDQAYIMSVLYDDKDGYLRYVHKDGLIMRHDKEAFAREIIETAWPGKFVGDLARILIFSYYARALPWPVTRIKEQIDPFTGCFVSRIPITVAYLRLALRSAWLFGQGKGDDARKLLFTAAARLTPFVEKLQIGDNPLETIYREEKRAWDIYYEVLEHVQKGLEKREGVALRALDNARGLIQSTRVI